MKLNSVLECSSPDTLPSEETLGYSQCVCKEDNPEVRLFLNVSALVLSCACGCR
jgi:hypothetical protein